MGHTVTLLASCVPSVCIVPFPADILLSRLGVRGEKWCLSAPLFLEKLPRDPCSTLRLVNKSPYRIPEAFFKLLFLCFTSEGLFFVVSLQNGDLVSSYPPASPRAKPLNFKVPGIKHQMILSTCKIWPLCFRAKCYRDSSFWCKFPMQGLVGVRVCPPPPLPIPLVSLWPTNNPTSPFSSRLFLYSCPLPCGLFCTFSYGRAVLPIFGLFSRLFTLIQFLSSGIVGTQ